MSKKAQMEISFGMIVSVILIIVFVAFTFYAIGKFLGMQRSVQIGKFTSDLQFDVDKIWKTSQGSQPVSYILPSRIEKVCFVDYANSEKGVNALLYEKLKLGFYGSENLIFYPVGSGEGLDSTIIEHINLEKITETQNPFCIENTNGKVKLTVSMDFGESLVKISK